ncbi:MULTISPECIES: precorrin-2 C(20)-methyltransferase [Prochlorococcus]|uniref:Precorrin-2 methylase n=1 Tax=Prochlorococcus marinus (strain SARG / CCMP1375 / SS120) TaxID=167539 RepID=Q7VDJ0_PROMA|nr:MULTISPECIES: precorrin-2 C(20)-methyltransferase [Prochlorococcus]AAP99432.1 Precorrin-2 methylase [Prochlorococcus marinus subsp. marinus str. CCMP1375]KGG11300.1 Cobalt-precorrin-2 C20-methyltransferase [Prochlorococcus marinus str. LG]KGG18746.1 Cobalt-precorrin-2 C20-methyltransferase [Prochlorococcus marinus str. SS2]KGG23019.1 Cobalt-precorrin-2 C20-methyltransferase [Prochlorococcus marinus str. SS35]KGG33726.1 Cobalt-precorrin-2 C20-methyltransferase [Prochlorococcus marinus str. S
MEIVNIYKRILSIFNPSLSSLKSKTGITFVGVGPGDPKLLTIAAVEAIKKATLVAYPVAKLGSKSMASEIACSFIKNKKCLPIVFPMITDNEALKRAWAFGANKLIEEVKKGEEVVLLSQGDPSLYSTSAYILLEIKSNFPLIPLKVIPGISSFNAAAAEAQFPLSLQKEELLICAVPDNPNHLKEMLDNAIKTKRVLVLIKLGKRWEWVRKVLDEKGLLTKTLFAKRIGFADQLTIKANNISNEEAPYFSLLIIREDAIF